MNTTVSISLPPEQLQLLEQVKELMARQVNFQIGGAWLTEKEAAQRLKVNECDIRTWRLEGWLRYFQVGAEVVYRTDYLDEDFEDHAFVDAVPGAVMNHQPVGVVARQFSYLEAATAKGREFKAQEKAKRLGKPDLVAARQRAEARLAK
ncbi:hypothetical protein ACWKW6_12930 [Dyadobacter jiangsuensis]